ncbi:MAG: sulfatase-like hydrolase/transferase [Kiritimatiellia bacterium]
MKIVKTVLAFCIAWCGLTEAVQLFARMFFRTWIAGDWFLILLASDSDEMWKFISYDPFPLTVFVLIVSVALALSVGSLFLKGKWWFAAFGAFGLYVVAGFACSGKIWTPAYLAYDTVRGVRDYVALVDAGRWTDRDEEGIGERTSGVGSELPTVVLVIGESLTTSRMGVYGYERDTTPQMKVWATNGLEVLPPRKATASYTAKALQDLLVKDGVSYIKAMRRKGYHPVLVSGQNHWERYCGVEHMVFAACERKRYLRDEMGGGPCYDWSLSRLAQEELEKARHPLLLIVHLMGSHYPFNERYPNYWTKADGMDDYDLSVRMTDSVVGDLLGMMPENGVLIFTSDHGESPNSASWRNAEDPDLWTVPMMIWRGSALKSGDDVWML